MLVGRMAVLGLLAALLALCQSCGQSCTKKGCTASVTVPLPSNTLSGDRPFSFYFCAGSACTTGTIQTTLGSVPCTTASWGICLASTGQVSSVTVLMNDRNAVEGNPVIVFKLSQDEEPVLERSGLATCMTFEPNGHDCGPTCRQGSLPVM